MKVHIKDRPEAMQNGGIARVVEAQYKYLPEFDIELVDLKDAELTAAHVMDVPYKEHTPAVVHNHGLYWRDYNFDHWTEGVNKGITETISQCQAVTVPSQWVRDAITRGMLVEPEVIYHGIDTDEWQLGESEDFILWNKARADEVSNPQDMQQLAALLPDVQFVSTLGEATSNVHITGVGSYQQMKDLISRAGLYLCTARETFGIGTLEALASGVPVVGWDYGGQHEIILQGETGYLAPYGDYQGLAAYVRLALSERKHLSANAYLDVRSRWQWKDKVEQYANLYKRVIREWNQPRPKVTVIIPSYNYANYLSDAVKSVQAQSFTEFECLIVDDCSQDETADVAREITHTDTRFHYYKTPRNMGLSAVRNMGAKKAQGKYIVYLDADDQLYPSALQVMSNALDQDRTIHIAYGMLNLLHGNGHEQVQKHFPSEFDWFKQMAHLNQVPTAAMMRKEVIAQSGGWRVRQWRAEDAEFWARVTSFGFRAKKVTDQPLLLYRIHEQSKGVQERREYSDVDGNWLAHMGWRSANSAAQGAAYVAAYPNQVPQEYLVPFGAQGQRLGKLFWDVWHRQEPLVTVIINIEGQDPTDVLDSLIGQDMDSWECYVVGEPVKGFPFVKFTKFETGIEPRGILTYKIKVPDTFLATTLHDFISFYADKVPEIQTWLDQHQPKPIATDKVLMRYIKQGRAKVNFRVNGNAYYVAHNDLVWMPPSDAQRVEGRGVWERIPQQTETMIPQADIGDKRR